MLTYESTELIIQTKIQETKLLKNVSKQYPKPMKCYQILAEGKPTTNMAKKG